MPTLSPAFLAHRYDPGHDAVHFIEADRTLRRRVPFLTDDNLPAATAPTVIARSDALHLGNRTAPVRIGFVFHSAYCCSTLVANAYDRPGRAVGFKEPVILNDIVGWRHRGGDAAAVGSVLGDALTLLARPFEDGETCIIKPSNVVNGLAPAILAGRPDASALLLYAPLEIYLGSIASKGLWGRRWVRDLLLKQLIDGTVELGFERNDYFLQTDLQVAAVGWLAQSALFARMATRWPDRVRTLDSETLLARPTETLAAADQLFGIRSTDDERQALVADVFGRNAKSGEAFDAAARAVGQQKATSLHGEEIATVMAWATAVADNAQVTLAPPHPLLD